MLTIREEKEFNEYKFLHSKAQKSRESKGRKKSITECDIRTVYQRDRDRIIHSKSFRRLKHKTQVFISPQGDHYRTRLTHTLEVSQIARTIGAALNLNEYLVEAIGLAHDLGHTPFGHAGEGAFSYILGRPFKHVEQSLKVVEKLEKDGEGLNLTYEVLDGIAVHSKGKGPIQMENINTTLEAVVVRISDIIAYVNHDIDDAIRASIICEDDIPMKAVDLLGNNNSRRIDALIKNVIFTTINNDYNYLGLDDEHLEAIDTLRDFLFQEVYENPIILKEVSKAKKILENLYHYYRDHTESIPKLFLDVNENKVEAVVDYISGMSDRYALWVYSEIFIPKNFNIL
jgi:dGTPase